MPEFRSKRVLQLRFPARAAELKRIREAVRESVEGCGCSAKSTADIVLAIDEACQNIIRHAYRRESDNVIELEIEHRGDANFCVFHTDVPLEKMPEITLQNLLFAHTCTLIVRFTLPKIRGIAQWFSQTHAIF